VTAGAIDRLALREKLSCANCRYPPGRGLAIKVRPPAALSEIHL
jgi:hypothetical protein